jgi:methanogenic corrinoid protein MtbC1
MQREGTLSTGTIEQLKMAVLEYDREEAASLAKKAIEEGVSPIEGLAALTDAIRQVGDGYTRGELWLPDLVGAADATEGATPVFEEELQRQGVERESAGTVILGTVYGDIHSIGKTMVGSLLTADGFVVYDIGIDIPAEKFVEEVTTRQPDILAMSSLLTTTAPEQRKVIRFLKEAGLRDKVKIMVGGGAITQEFANEIGADGFETTAPGAAKLARKLVSKK